MNEGIHSLPSSIIPKVRTVVVRYGEIGIKGRNRNDFIRCLVKNIRQPLLLYGLDKIVTRQGMILAYFKDDMSWSDVGSTLSRVFGLKSASICHETGRDVASLDATVKSAVKEISFDTFAVRGKRLDKSFSLSSADLNIQYGKVVEEQTGAQVDLENPEVTIGIEIHNRGALVSTCRVTGPGGLPVGISGRVGVLLSGGIDSPVAAWQMMKRGCGVELLHFHSAPLTRVDSQEKVVELAEILSRWHGPVQLAMIPFGEIQQQIVASSPPAYRVILYRRFMVRIASRLAVEKGCNALVTGDSLGQVASQTLSNLATIEAASAVPVLRPLISFDKEEIVAKARLIGTYELSIQPHQDCCGFLLPREPATRSRISDLERVERGLDVVALVEAGVRGVSWQMIE